MRLFLAATLLAVAASAEAQRDVTIRGTVMTESGRPIDRANVSVSELGISTLTSASGAFSVVIPLEQSQDRLVAMLRVRAIGHLPQSQAIRITVDRDGRATIVGGTGPIDILMKRDPSSAVDVATTDYERARVPFAVARPSATNVPGQADPFGRFLFPPELVMQHQGALNLQDAQREALQTAIQEAQTQMLRLQWALAAEGEKLTKLLSAEAMDEKEVLAQVDRILMTEREIKRAQMTLMVRIRNTLTPEQRARLRQARGEREE